MGTRRIGSQTFSFVFDSRPATNQHLPKSAPSFFSVYSSNSAVTQLAQVRISWPRPVLASSMSHSCCARCRATLTPLAFLVLTILPGIFAAAQTPAPAPQPDLPSALPACPATGLVSAQSTHYNSQRKVILSWNASAPSPKSENAVVGYCLYRSKTQSAAQLLPTCNQCERINPVPVTGTSCVDDLVEDRATYYYVVTAVTARGSSSTASNEASAQIVKLKQPSTLDSGKIPACRAGSNGAVPSAR